MHVSAILYVLVICHYMPDSKVVLNVDPFLSHVIDDIGASDNNNGGDCLASTQDGLHTSWEPAELLRRMPGVHFHSLSPLDMISIHNILFNEKHQFLRFCLPGSWAGNHQWVESYCALARSAIPQY